MIGKAKRREDEAAEKVTQALDVEAAAAAALAASADEPPALHYKELPGVGVLAYTNAAITLLPKTRLSNGIPVAHG